MLKKFAKDPNAVLDYTINWTAWLAPAGDAITNATATAPSGITIDSVSKTSTTTTVWLSGGVTGTKYDVVVHITTAGGRQDDRTIQIEVKEF